MTPFLTLFFMNMQFPAVFELLFLVLLGFFVVVPVANEHIYWELDAFVERECSEAAARVEVEDPELCITLQVRALRANPPLPISPRHALPLMPILTCPLFLALPQEWRYVIPTH